MKKKLSVIFCLAMLFYSVANAVVIVTFDFEGEVLTPAIAESGYEVSDFSYVGSGSASFPTGSGSTDSFSANGWPTSATLDPYFSFTVTPDSGFAFSLTSVDFDERRSGTGPTTFTVQYAIGGGSFTTLGTSSVADISTWTNETFDTTPMSVATSSPVEVRIFATNAEGTSGTWRVDDVVAFGTISAVPEPAAAGLLGAILSLAFVVSRKRAVKKT